MKRKNITQLQDILERLERLDEDVELTFDDDTEFKCYIVGGGAFMIMGYSMRSTHDIDVLEAMPKVLQSLFKKYDMNCDVMAYSDNFPLGYEERARQVKLNTYRVKFYTLSLEDLVISKLCTTRHEQDDTDIESEKVVNSINWVVLEQLAQSMSNTMISSQNYENFWYNYSKYVRRFRDACIDI